MFPRSLLQFTELGIEKGEFRKSKYTPSDHPNKDSGQNYQTYRIKCISSFSIHQHSWFHATVHSKSFWYDFSARFAFLKAKLTAWLRVEPSTIWKTIRNTYIDTSHSQGKISPKFRKKYIENGICFPKDLFCLREPTGWLPTKLPVAAQDSFME